MVWYEKTALVLAAIGAINWGLDVAGYNAVQLLLGWNAMIMNTVYVVVALCGVYALVKAFK